MDFSGILCYFPLNVVVESSEGKRGDGQHPKEKNRVNNGHGKRDKRSYEEGETSSWVRSGKLSW